MEIEKALTLNLQGRLKCAQIWKNPNDLNQWFIMIIQDDGKSFILVDAMETPIVDEDIKALFETVRQIGFKKAEVYF